MKMKQSVLVGQRESEVKEVDIPKCGEKDVLIRVNACGVCRSELHGWKDGESFPRELGHEVGGIVESVGSEVERLQPGMLVTGFAHKGYAEYSVHPEAELIAVPDGISPIEASMGEPLAGVVSAARRTKVELGDTVAMVGLGFMGLLTLQCLRHKGAKRIIAIDVRQEALDTAKTMGADETYLASDLPDKLRLTEWWQMGKGYGVDVAVESTGSQPALTLAGELVKEHGFLSIVGYHQGGLREVNFELWNWKALDILNAHDRRIPYQLDCMERGFEMVKSGQIDLKSLISNKYSIDNVDQAFQDMVDKPKGFKKAVVVVKE